jgi:hypothetical protein
LINVFPLKNYCNLFIHDVNDDGKPEFIWLQSMGCLDSYSKKVSFIWQPSQPNGLFHLLVTTVDGKMLWSYGVPYPGNNPFISHFCEGYVRCCRFGEKNKKAILALAVEDEIGKLLVIDAVKGELIQSVNLPRDDFFWILVDENNPIKSAQAIALSNGDMGYYEPNPEGNRTVFFDSSFKAHKTVAAKGEGHYPACFDADGDGYDEFFLGYNLFDHDGSLLWTVDYWKERSIREKAQHADQIYIYTKEGEQDWYGLIAGSDALYMVDRDGHMRWRREGPHVQHLVVGKLLKNDPKDYIFILNCRIEMNLYDLEGNEIWKGKLTENWPFGRPLPVKPDAFHMGRPMSLWKNPLGDGQDLIVYNEAGWPYVIDGQGNRRIEFPCPENSRQSNSFKIYGFPCFDDNPPHRPDDWGYGYYTRVHDIDCDGKEEVIIYDRKHCWIYGLS